MYPNPPIPLNYLDDFTLLVAVILSAQTTDGKVNHVTKDLFKLCRNASSLAKMSHEELLRIIRPVGLAPTKAKNLIRMAQMIIEDFQETVPSTMEELQRLPGVGRKTANVIISQAFGQASFPVDTHIHRLTLRWGLAPEKANVAVAEQMLRALFPQSLWSALHLQMIYFGREWCQARNHTPKDCPICCWAGAAAQIRRKREPRGRDEGHGEEEEMEKTTETETAEEDARARNLKFPDPPTHAEICRMVPPKKASKQIILYSERIKALQDFERDFATHSSK